ncbi:MAG: undecaprenyl-diphosphate phosphatase [Candidatus Neomarinimicrobiota bacterium]
MTIFEALLLGILQGITEFLPISSSGHLVLGEHLLGVITTGLVFEVAVHLGTLCSIIYVFRDDLLELLRSLRTAATWRLILTIVIGTIPAVVVGLGFKDRIEAAFDSIQLVGAALMVTGLLLILTRWARERGCTPGPLNGFIIGLAQALAILPGISRSGSTISMALFLGISGEQAARFSFLLAIPAILGAGVLHALDIAATGTAASITPAVLTGFLSSLAVGIVALKFLLRTLKSGRFHWFGIYCLAVGLLTLVG